MKKLLFTLLLGFSFSFGGNFVKADSNDADCYKSLSKECRERVDCPEYDELK